MASTGLPAILYVRDLRKILPGWDADRVRRFLVTNRLALTDETGHVYTTVLLLRERMPNAVPAMEAVWASVLAGEKFNPEDFSDLDAA